MVSHYKLGIFLLFNKSTLQLHMLNNNAPKLDVYFALYLCMALILFIDIFKLRFDMPENKP